MQCVPIDDRPAPARGSSSALRLARGTPQWDKTLTEGITRCHTLQWRGAPGETVAPHSKSNGRREGEGGREKGRRTGRDHGHVDQAEAPHLPVRDGLPDMPRGEALLFSDRRVVVLCGATVSTPDPDSGSQSMLFQCLLLRWTTYARSSGVRNRAVSGKSTKTSPPPINPTSPRLTQ